MLVWPGVVVGQLPCSATCASAVLRSGMNHQAVARGRLVSGHRCTRSFAWSSSGGGESKSAPRQHGQARGQPRRRPARPRPGKPQGAPEAALDALKAGRGGSLPRASEGAAYRRQRSSRHLIAATAFVALGMGALLRPSQMLTAVKKATACCMLTWISSRHQGLEAFAVAGLRGGATWLDAWRLGFGGRV